MAGGASGLWQSVVASMRVLRQRLQSSVVLAGLVVVVVAAAAVIWANSLTQPVTVIGAPTATVAPLPAKTSALPPSPTPTISTPPPSPSPSRSPQPKTMASSGKFDLADLSIGSISSSGTLRRYALQVETSSGLKASTVARQVAGILNDPRSWAGSGSLRFALIADPTKADFTISLSSPGTAAKTCRLSSGTCVSGSQMVIDALAWKTTAATYAGNGADWQSYLANHGVGVMLGKKPATCPKAARPAPAMMPQQADLGGCTPNPWPYP